MEALIGNRPFEEEKVVTFDVEEGKDKITTEETTVADAASAEQVIATPEQPVVESSDQASVATTEQAIASDDTEKTSGA